MEFWTTRDDNDWGKCDIYFAYIGDEVFVPIERFNMSLLNRVVQWVPLYDIPHVKPKRVHKQKSVTSNEETTTGDKERKTGRGKQKASESEPKIVESASSEPKRRGRKPKNKDDTSKPEIEDVVKGKTRGWKPKKRDAISNAEMSKDVVTEKKRGCKPTPPEKENVVKRKRGRPKKHVIRDNINNDDNDDVFCEPPQLKRKVYNRESKLKGKVFIKVVMGKNKKGKKGKKHGLETGFNDIDILLENMGKTETSVDGDSNMEKCNLQVATINQMEEVQIKKECTHNNSTESGKEKIETEVTEGIVAEVKEITDIFTDGIVTYGTGSEDKMVTQVTVTGDVIVTDGTGSEDKMDTQIRDGKETNDTDTVAKEVKEGIETEVTNNMATVQATEREQPAEQVLDKNVTV